MERRWEVKVDWIMEELKFWIERVKVKLLG
jgi:hypothetical protein